MPCSSGVAIERSYTFKGFRQALRFVNVVATEAEKAQHHPEWAHTWRTVWVRWTTHRDRTTGKAGLSEQDLRLAGRCDELADEMATTGGKGKLETKPHPASSSVKG